MSWVSKKIKQISKWICYASNFQNPVLKINDSKSTTSNITAAPVDPSSTYEYILNSRSKEPIPLWCILSTYINVLCTARYCNLVVAKIFRSFCFKERSRCPKVATNTNLKLPLTLKIFHLPPPAWWSRFK